MFEIVPSRVGDLVIWLVLLGSIGLALLAWVATSEQDRRGRKPSAAELKDLPPDVRACLKQVSGEITQGDVDDAVAECTRLRTAADQKAVL